ncbi:MAG: cytochrome c biogenesis protein CcsA [Candidatus Caenarcaniphilales bacterium]|nr:cytochrome c biogenesis protein CcsA [Candidatus Caenarcaniphilales bacterium]
MKKLLILTFTLFLSFANLALTASAAESETNNKYFPEIERLTILDSGRLKPFDTYARNKLLQFSGRTKIKYQDKKLSASEWLSLSIFEPEKAESIKVFLINNPQIAQSLNITEEEKRHYNYLSLRDKVDLLNDFASKAFEKEEKKRDLIDKEFIRTFTNFHNYSQLINSFSLFQTKNSLKYFSQGKIAKGLNISANPTIYELSRKAPKLEQLINSKDKELRDGAVKLGFALFSWIESYKDYLKNFSNEETLTFIYNDSKTYNPWSLFFNLQDKNKSFDPELINDAAKLQLAYDSEDNEIFNELINNFNSRHDKKANISLELLFNKLNPLAKSMFFYIFAFILGMIYLIKSNKSKLLALSSKTFLTAGFLFHLFAVISRILILERAPVSNLYETFVFVALVVVLLGITMQSIDKKYLYGTLSSSISGFILLLIASKFAMEGDTMKVLIAVLNSNFWLSTHVIAEMIGYAGVSLAGLLGHFYLIKSVNNPEYKTDEELKFLNKTILGMVGFGLLFTFLGTMLGGVWADQSWGRFWGWDPKENGALLIILWTAITLHARIAGYIKEFGTAIFAILGTVVVMVSWFGVNLLGVGLHSYGFTEGLARNLFMYIGFEFLYILVAIAFYKKFQKNA